MAGRRPKPTHLRVVTGNPGKRPLNDAEPPAPPGAPPEPAHLSRLAAQYWRRIVPALDRMGVLTTVDATVVERLCETYAEVRDLQAEIDTLGSRTYECRTEGGGVMHRAYPQVAQMADADRRLKGYLVELGLTPASRSKVRVPGGSSKVDPADRYFG